MNWRDLIILLKSGSAEVIDSKREEISDIIPMVRIMFDYDQNNKYHPYNLWEHCVHTVCGLPDGIDDDMLYIAALLHDIGKPDCKCKSNKEDDPSPRYYGHPARSEEIVRENVIPYLISGEYR